MDNTNTSDVEFLDIDSPEPASSPRIEVGETRTVSKEEGHDETNNESDSDSDTNNQNKEINKQAKNAPTPKSDQTKEPQKIGNKDKFETRISKMERIRDEIKAENDRRERISQSPQPQQPVPNGQQSQAQTKSEPEFVPKPQPPQYSKEDLTKWYNEAKSKDDQTTMQACIEGLQQWKDHDIELRFWKTENGQQLEKFQASWNDNWTKATTKYPDLKDKNSELYKEADKLARKFPEVLNRKQADGQFLIAQLASLRSKVKSHDSVVGALKEKLQKATEQLESYQKRAQPASQGTKPNLSKPGAGGTAEEKLAQKLGL